MDGLASKVNRANGFAAGCEAALGAAVNEVLTRRATPSVRALPKRLSHLGPSPNCGHSPIPNHDFRRSRIVVQLLTFEASCHDQASQWHFKLMSTTPRVSVKHQIMKNPDLSSRVHRVTFVPPASLYR